MKYLFSALLAFFAFSSFGQDASITIDINRIIDEVDPNIYGIFMEPIGYNRNGVEGNTLYGPVYNPESPVANSDGFNTEYIEAARELKITNMRWPGGNFTSNYHWTDGIGPKAERPVRKELMWGVNESNQVGTDEWVQLNSAIGSENVVCINMGTGTINEALEWIEYCNGAPGTYYADLRVKYGNREPFKIKYWCLGNEVDGSPWIIGYKNADDYCKEAIEIAKAMKKVDPAIKLVANGSAYYQPNMDWVNWNWQVLNELKDHADYLSLHRYWEYDDDYYSYMGKQALELEEKISVPAAQSKAVQSIYKMDKPMYLSFDEWAPHGFGLLSTLASAQFLNAFIRHADMVKMANYTLLTSILSHDPETGKTFKTPFFYTFKAFSNNCLGTAVDAYVICDTFNVDNEYKGIPYLDVSTVYNQEKHILVINVVNRHKDKPISTDLLCVTGKFNGNATVTEINSTDLRGRYSIDKKEDYVPQAKKIKTVGKNFTYSFPAHSFTQIMVELEE